MPTQDIFSEYKKLRNRTAALAIDDSLYVIWSYCQYLGDDDFQLPNDIEVDRLFHAKRHMQAALFPWQLELLAKEIILNSGNTAQDGKTLRSWKTLSDTVNELNRLEEKISEIYGSPENVLVELIRIAHRQFIWQLSNPNKALLVRYFKIFNDPAIDEIGRSIFGISMEDIYLCGLMFYSSAVSLPAILWPIVVDDARLPKDAIEPFLAFACRSLGQLRPILREGQKYNAEFPYAYNALRQFPLIRMNYRGRDSIVCPLPTLLFWKLTGGLYYDLASDVRFANALGQSFERYVGQVLARACPRLTTLAAEKYGSRREPKETVDWIVSDGEAALFIECKAKRISWTAKTALEDTAPLEAELARLAAAILQLYKTIRDYEQDKYPTFRFDATRKVFPVVVTLENWHFFGPVMHKKLRDALVAQLAAQNLSPDVLDENPYSVWHVSDLEFGMQAANKIGLAPFLEPKLNDREMTEWELQPYMERQFGTGLPNRFLFEEEYFNIFARVIPRRQGAPI